MYSLPRALIKLIAPKCIDYWASFIKKKKLSEVKNIWIHRKIYSAPCVKLIFRRWWNLLFAHRSFRVHYLRHSVERKLYYIQEVYYEMYSGLMDLGIILSTAKASASTMIALTSVQTFLVSTFVLLRLNIFGRKKKRKYVRQIIFSISYASLHFMNNNLIFKRKILNYSFVREFNKN